jgi:hypothetical protein
VADLCRITALLLVIVVALGAGSSGTTRKKFNDLAIASSGAHDARSG